MTRFAFHQLFKPPLTLSPLVPEFTHDPFRSRVPAMTQVPLEWRGGSTRSQVERTLGLIRPHCTCLDY